MPDIYGIPDAPYDIPPESTAFWMHARRHGVLYPEEVYRVVAENNLPMPEEVLRRENQHSTAAGIINAVAKALGVGVDTWRDHIIAHTTHEALFNFPQDITDQVRTSETNLSLGRFIMEAAYSAVPLEGNIDGSAKGITLVLSAGETNAVTFSSESELWYPEYEKYVDNDGFEQEGGLVDPGGYSYTINVAVDSLQSIPGEVVEDDAGMVETPGF